MIFLDFASGMIMTRQELEDENAALREESEEQKAEIERLQDMLVVALSDLEELGGKDHGK